MAKRWRALALMAACLAGPALAAKHGRGSSAAGSSDAQIQAQDYALAEQFFQRGRFYEQMSDEQFAAWVRGGNGAAAGLDTKHLDQWRGQELLAMEEYQNGVRLNPGDWRLHKRLGLLFHRNGGVLAHHEKALLHLVAYLALKPNDPPATLAMVKDFVDQDLAEFEDIHYRTIQQSLFSGMAVIVIDDHGGGYKTSGTSIWGMLQFRDESGDPVVMTEFLGLLAGLQKFKYREAEGGFSMASLIKPGIFTDANTLQLNYHDWVDGIWGQSPDSAYIADEAPTDFATAARRALEQEVLSSAEFVPAYLSIIGQTHSFIDYLNQRKLTYDARPLQMLLGEATAQLRIGLLRADLQRGDSAELDRSKVEGAFDRVKAEAARFTQLGGVSVQDLFGVRDPSKSAPDFFVAAGQMPEPDKDKAEYEALRGLMYFGAPAMFAADTHEKSSASWPSESWLTAYDLATFECYKAWMNWSSVLLDRTARLIGMGRPADLLVADYVKVGTGELSTWVRGPLPAPQRVSSLSGDRRWLVASN
jgi:hypothetical protein